MRWVNCEPAARGEALPTIGVSPAAKKPRRPEMLSLDRFGFRLICRTSQATVLRRISKKKDQVILRQVPSSNLVAGPTRPATLLALPLNGNARFHALGLEPKFHVAITATMIGIAIIHPP